MKVFCHHVYEYKKGLRNLVLHTTRGAHRPEIEEKLTREGIPYLIHPLGNGNINVFFGNELCIEVVRRIADKRLSDLTDEEDFILGIMLGYDRLQQCARYLKRKRKEDVGELAG
ncbi:DUF2023 family protein [Deferrisoma sp.]